MKEQTRSTGQYKIATVNVKDLEFLEKNARYMTAEMFRNLVDNVKRDGGLSSMPLCWKHGDKYRILSGNHRCAAAIEAGLQEVTVLYTDRELSRQEQVAIQISHNAIDGKDDMVVLKELWDELEDVDLKYYAGIDDKTLEEMEKLSMAALADVNLDFHSTTFLFLPDELEKLNNAIEYAMKYSSTEDSLYLNRLDDFKRLLKAQNKIQSSFDVKNSATSLMIILDIFNRHQEDLVEGYIDEGGNLRHKNKVPLSSVLGDDYVSPESALILKKAVEKAIGKGEVQAKNKVEFLQRMSEKYLKGD